MADLDLPHPPLRLVRDRDGAVRPGRPGRAHGLLAEEPRGISAPDLSAAGDSAFHSRHFRRLAFSPGAQNDDDRRSVLRRADPDLDPALAIWAHHPAAGSLRPHQRLFPHPDQSIPGRAGAALQLLPAGFRQRHSGRRRSAPGRVLVPAHVRVRADCDDRHCRWHRRVLRRLEFRAAMAPMDDGLLHLALAHAFDALQAGAFRHRRQRSRPSAVGRVPRFSRPNRQPRPAHLAGYRRLHQRHRDRHQFRQRRHIQLHHPGDRLRDQSRVVLDHPVGNLQLPQRANFRSAKSRVFCSGSRSSTPAWRQASPSSSAEAFPGFTSASRRSKRTSASISRASANTANRLRFSRARIARSTAPAACLARWCEPFGASSMFAPG